MDFVNGARSVRRQRSRDTRGRRHRGQRLRFERNRKRAWRLMPSSSALKVLDANGRAPSATSSRPSSGCSRTATYNIRIVNLSVGAAIHRIVLDRPADACGQARGRRRRRHCRGCRQPRQERDGHPQYGGVKAPGNAPWVLTVGASSTNGTVDAADDTMAIFSSRGPDVSRLGREAGPRRARRRHVSLPMRQHAR